MVESQVLYEDRHVLLESGYHIPLHTLCPAMPGKENAVTRYHSRIVGSDQVDLIISVGDLSRYHW